MSVEDLLELFDIESAEDFSYFEQFASIIEHQEEIESDLFYDLISMANRHALVEMTENYFLDIMQGIPDDNMDLYSTMSSIKEMMVILANASNRSREKALYLEALESFRNWFVFQKNILCKNEKTKESFFTTVHEALVLYRLEKLSGEKYLYDFSQALPYEADEYALIVAEELQNDFDEKDEYSDGGDYRDNYDDYDVYGRDDIYEPRSEHYYDADPDFDYESGQINPWTEGLIDRNNPVIDDADQENEYE